MKNFALYLTNKAFMINTSCNIIDKSK